MTLITTTRNELAKRLPKKSWWDDGDVDAFIEEENKDLEELMNSLKDRLSVTEVSGNHKDYYQAADQLP